MTGSMGPNPPRTGLPYKGLLVFFGWLFCHVGTAAVRPATNSAAAPPRADPSAELVRAAFAGDRQKILALLAGGADARARTGTGLTAWQAARIRGRSDLMDLLAKAGADPHRTTPEAARILDWYVRERIKPDSPGLALAVVDNGNVLFKHGWGLASLEHGIPVTPRTVFHVASVSKQFTAYAVACLVREGRLSLDDDIRRHLPDMPDFGAVITVGDLLHHTSGLRDQWMLLSLARRNPGGVVSQNEVMGLLRRQRELLFGPGERHEYCNSGYTLLAEIVAKVSGRPFGTFAMDEVFRPLRMTNSRFHTNCEEVVRNLADSYYPLPGGGYRKALMNYETVGATGLHTTVEDLAAWLANVEHPGVGSAATLAMMVAPGNLKSGATIGYGMGLFLEDYRGMPLVQHGGGDAGYRSFVLWFPTLHFGVALASNLGSIDARDIALTAAEIYLGDRLKPTSLPDGDRKSQPVQLPAHELDRYVGIYGLYWRLTHVQRVGDHLEIHEDNYPPELLVAEGNNRFSSGRRTFDFRGPESGKALRFTDDWKEEFTRIDVIPETPSDLGAYAGEYWSDELESFLRVRPFDGRLILELPGRGEIAMQPVGRNLYASTNDPGWFTLSFRRDAGDAVDAVRLNSILYRRFVGADHRPPRW